MGTRNLTAVRYGNALKVAQYGQWDGYPTGQGDTISTFLRTADLDRFTACVRELEWYTPQEIHDIWKDAGADDTGWVTSDVSDKVRNAHPELSRNTGAEILQLIHDGKVAKVKNDWEFIKDTLFCEYAYVVDLDKEVVEVYADNYKPLDDVSEYKPEKDVPAPVAVIPFAEFAKEGRMEQLEKELNPEEEND